MNLTILALALVVGDGGDSSAVYEFAGGDDRAELKRGEWLIVGMTVQGKTIPPEELKGQDLRLRFKGEKVVLTRGGGKPQQYEITINPHANPRQLNWTLPVFGEPEAIYRLENGTLTIAVPGWGKDRPKSFSDVGIEMVLILKRVQPDDPPRP
jgi:uncharacterized protein (TIGR03067 family)